MPRVLDLCPELTPTPSRVPGWRWFVHGERGVEAVRACEPHLSGEAGLEVEPLEIKGGKELAILRTGSLDIFWKRMTPDSGGRLRETLRLRGLRLGRKGAVTEAAQTLLAARKLDRTAELYALGERTYMGVVVEQVLLLEGLTDHVQLARVLEDAEDPRDALERTFELLLELDAAGLAHLDGHAKNVMLSNAAHEQDRLVDLEQLVEVEPRRPDVLGFAFGYLFRLGVQDHVSRRDYEPLALRALSRAFGDERPPDLALLAFRHFQKCALRRRERLRMAQHGLSALGSAHARIYGRSAEKIWRRLERSG
ncbi:MAG: hypothetical protein GY711_17840 [bacterium]|nr:hypothetical protein [bacterium]